MVQDHDVGWCLIVYDGGGHNQRRRRADQTRGFD